MRVYSLQPERHWVLVSAHRLVADAESLGVLLDEAAVPAPAPIAFPSPAGHDVVAVRDLSSTPADSLMATVFLLLLHRYTGRDHVTIVHGAGFVTLDLGDDPTFVEALERTEAALASACENPVPRDVHAAYVAVGNPSLLGGLGRSPFDLQLMVAGSTVALRGHPDLYEQEVVELMLDHLDELVVAVAAHPDRRLSHHPLITAQEERELAGWNATGRDHTAMPWAHEAFRARALDRPDAAALRFEGRTVSYGELHRRVEEVAWHLHERGVGRGDVVGIALERSPELVVAQLATLAAGAAYLPLDPDYPAERIGFMVDDTRPALVLTDDVLHGIEAQPGRLLPPVPVPVGPQDAAYVIYTSGSTGRPKGVLVPHAALRNHLAWMQAAFPLAPHDRVLLKSPSSFDVSVWETFLPLVAGATVVLAAPGGQRDLEYLIEVIEQEAVTTAEFVPSVLRLLVEDPDVDRCRSLRRVFSGSEVLGPELADRVLSTLDCELHNMYGPTETTVGVTTWPCRAGATSVPIGVAIDNTTIHLWDAAGREVPIGAPGEICVGGVQVAHGYLGRPALTAARFVPDPFAPHPGARVYCTGDRGRRRPDGALEFLGRVDRQVKVHGNRVEIGEIEARLSAHPAVRDCVVTVTTTTGAAVLDAHVVPAGGASLDPAALLDDLRRQLPSFMVPNRVHVLDALPTTPSGKVDHAALAAQEPDMARGPTPVPPGPEAPFTDELMETRRGAQVRRSFTLPGDVTRGLLDVGVPVRSLLLAAHMKVVAFLGGGDLAMAFVDAVPVSIVLHGGTWWELATRLAATERSAPLQRRAQDGALPCSSAFAYNDVELVRRSEGSALSAVLPLVASFDLRHRSELTCRLDVDDPRRVHLIESYYRNALAAIAAAPNSSVDVDLRPDEERALIRASNDTQRSWPTDWTAGAHRRVAEQSQRRPDAIAIRCGGRQISYGDLELRTAALTHQLEGRGVTPGDVVPVGDRDAIDRATSLLAVHRVGGIYNPLDPGSEAIVTKADPRDLAHLVGGVEITHDALDNALFAVRERVGWQDEDEVLLACEPATFGVPGFELLLALSTGARVELLAPDPGPDVTTMWASLAVWRRLVEDGWPGDPALRLVCDEPLPGDLRHALGERGRSLWTLYGYPQAMAVAAARSTADDEAPLLGAPLANTTCDVVGSGGQPVPLGVPGELLVGGRGRLYRTGDVVRRRFDGQLELVAQ